MHYNEHNVCVFTGTKDAQLLDWRNKVEVRGEQVHEGSRVNHKHKHAEAIDSHLLPVKDETMSTGILHSSHFNFSYSID